MPKKKDKHMELNQIKSYVDIEEFIKYHRKRIKILKEILKKYDDRRLVTSVVIICLESLAKFRYPQDDSSKRFIKLFSKIINRTEAKRFYQFYRCPYVHEGFPNPFTDFLENDNLPLMGTCKKDLMISTTGMMGFPVKTLITIYEELVDYVDDYFVKKGTVYRILESRVYSNSKYEETCLKEMQKRIKDSISKTNLRRLI